MREKLQQHHTTIWNERFINIMIINFIMNVGQNEACHAERSRR